MLNERLKELRLKYGLTQQQVGNAIGVSKMSISRFESGLETPKEATRKKYAEFFNCDIEDLIGCAPNVIRKQDLKAIEAHLMGLWLDLIAEVRVQFGNDAYLTATERMLKIDTGKITASVKLPLDWQVFQDAD